MIFRGVDREVPRQITPDQRTEGFRTGKWRFAWTVAVVAVLVIPFTTDVLYERFLAEKRLAEEEHWARVEADHFSSLRTVEIPLVLPRGTRFMDLLLNEGIDRPSALQILDSARPVYNLSRVRAGKTVTILRAGTGELRAITYPVDPGRIVWITKRPDGFHAEIRVLTTRVEVTGLSGTVTDSLFAAVEALGEDDLLALRIADIFGWDIDFNIDPRPGDRFEILVEKRMMNDKFLAYGRILAAEFDNAGRVHRAVLFRDSSGRESYYSPDGKSLQKAFLRSPLKFGARVSSRFSYHRFHPLLKRYRPHLGIDYGVPTGSPVQAVADGRVVSAGCHDASGTMIRLAHAKGYETYYLHLSRTLVRVGQRVRQGQIIALTGASGLATGPHLDFRITQHGRYRNFLGFRQPPADSVPRREWNFFALERDGLLDKLASLAHVPHGIEQATLGPRSEASNPPGR